MRRFVQAFAGAELGQPTAVHEAADRYNIGKGDEAWVIIGPDAVWTEMVWGLVPAWSKTRETPYTTITSRLERAPKSRVFGSAWRARHCLVPMLGYYKWDRTVKPGAPHFIQSASGDVLFAAGLWEAWEREEPELMSFSILTHENKAIPSPLTPDGPIFLPAQMRAPWLAATMLLPQARLSRARQPILTSYPVSRAYRDRSIDDYTLIEPASAGAVQPTAEDVLDDEDE